MQKGFLLSREIVDLRSPSSIDDASDPELGVLPQTSMRRSTEQDPDRSDINQKRFRRKRGNYERELFKIINRKQSSTRCEEVSLS